MRSCEHGRSMIEMLGVLAIIGVLSVGGLAGYTKMMMQNRINTTMQQINVISARLSAAGAEMKSYKGLTNAAAVKLGAVPSELGSGSSLTNAFGGNVTIAASSLEQNGNDGQAYAITYTGLPVEACIALISSGWSNSRSSALLGVGVGANAASNIYQGCPGTASVACPDGKNNPLPMELDKAATACNCSTNDCVFTVKYF